MTSRLIRGTLKQLLWESRAKFSSVVSQPRYADKCVETIYLPSLWEDEIVHSSWKHEG